MTMAHTNEQDPWIDRLSEYADGELSESDRRDLEAHLRGCAACRETLDELRAVAAHARSLGDAPPAADLWPGVAARLGNSGGGPARVFEMRAARRFSFTLPQLVAAALALMVLSGGMVWMARLGGDRADFPAVGAVPAAVPVALGATHYDAAIADLQEALEAGRAQLDDETVRVLERNLLAIDRAIEQSRRALADDPGNLYLNDHLAAAKKRKLALLRRATAIADGPTLP
jgi:anti-sigma factor RsiW